MTQGRDIAQPTRPEELVIAPLLPVLDRLGEVDFWREIHPGEPITALVPASSTAGARAPRSTATELERLAEEGYFVTEPWIVPEVCRRMAACVEAVRRAGLPIVFSLVYDVFHQVLADLEPVLEPVLGGEYRVLPGFWTYRVPADGRSSGYEPHRDADYGRALRADGRPTVVNVWVAVTEASPRNGCMYVLPADRDPGYPAAAACPLEDRETFQRVKFTRPDFDLQDVRALPMQAGAVGVWDQYLYHWGGRSARGGGAPRISFAIYLQSSDIESPDPRALHRDAPIDLGVRLGMIFHSLLRYSVVGDLRGEVEARPIFAAAERWTARLGVS